MIAQELEVSLHMAFVEARQKQHEFITVEHLLLAMLDNPSAAEVLKACGVDLDELRGVLSDFIQEHTPRLAPHSDADTQPTQGFQRVIQRAILHVQSSGKKEVTGANVLVAIFGEKESHAVYFLNQRGVTRLDVVNYIAHGITKTPQQKQDKQEAKGDDDNGNESQGALDAYTLNLNALAKAGKIDPLIGREHELERVIQVLCRRRKNNPLLVGEAGVGKTAIAEGLARRINEGDVPELLRRLPGVFARHGRAARRHQVPRRFRAAAEGRAEAAGRQPEVDPVHRRDPHDHRRRRGVGRHARRVQPAEAGVVDRRAEVHRRDDLQRVPADLREGPRAVAALPEGRRAGAVDRRDDRDPQGPEDALRAAPRRQVRAGGAHERGGARRALHQRPPPAGQGDRRDRRGRRRAEDPAQVAAEEGDRQDRGRGDRREDRAHPREERVVRRPQCAAARSTAT